MPGISPNFPTTGIFGPGFQLQTRDEEFQLQFHDLTQVDGRFYTQGQQVPITSTFLIPRQWFIFSGRLIQAVRVLRFDRRGHRQSEHS